MTDHYVVWHDVEDYEPRRTFELIRVPPEKLAPEDRVVPSMGGFRTIYIRWHQRQFEQDQLYLVTYTHQPLNQEEAETLLDRAIKFIRREEQENESRLPRRWEPGVRVESHRSGAVYAIEVSDDLTHQLLLLSPAELRQLRDLLNNLTDPGPADPAPSKEARRLKALALYNGHSLPSIDRQGYERENSLTVRFHFEVSQVVDGEARKVGEL